MKKLLLSIAAVAAAACGSYSAAADTTIFENFGNNGTSNNTTENWNPVFPTKYATTASSHKSEATGITYTVVNAMYTQQSNKYFLQFKSATATYVSFTLPTNCKSIKLTNGQGGAAKPKAKITIGDADAESFTFSTDNDFTYTLASPAAEGTTIKIVPDGNAIRMAALTYTIADNGGGEDPVDPVEPGFKWMLGDTDADRATVTLGATNNVFPTLYNPNNVPVTYSIAVDGDDPAPATIDPATGAITLLNSGAALVYAKSEATAQYFARSEYYILFINPAAPETKCATPTFSHPSGVVAKGTEVTISCTTEGAKLMYFLDEEPYEAEGNTVTVTINQDTDISAWAEKEGLEDSDIAEASYLVDEQGGTDPVEGTVTFRAPSETDDVTGVDFAHNSEDNLIGTEYKSGPITLTITADSPNDNIAIYNSGKEVRWYNNNFITLTPDKNYAIEEVYVRTVSNSKGDFSASSNGLSAGTVSGTGVGAGNPITWTGSVTAPLLLTPNKQVRFGYMTVKYKEDTTGIDNVTANDENAPVEYFNLQGIRVENPQGGVYIRRQGSTVTKVLVK